MTSLLASIQAALRPGTTSHSLEGETPGAVASILETAPSGALTQEVVMDSQTQPGASTTSAELTAAVAKATADGKAGGFKAAMDRLGAIMGAEGISGDGARMAAAMELAGQSPDMAAEAVVAFVTKNVSASGVGKDQGGDDKPAGAQAGDYEHRRLGAAGLAQPGAGAAAPKVTIDRTAIFAARRNA